MSITLHETTPLAPPRVVIFGPGGVGKSSWPLGAPRPIFLPLEDGIPRALPDGTPIKVASVTTLNRRILTNLDDFDNALEGVLALDHSYETLVVDNFTALQSLVGAKIAKDEGVDTYEAVPYGVGYGLLGTRFAAILRKLDEIREKRNMAIIGIAHRTISTTEDLDSGSGVYSRIEMRLQHGKNVSIRSMVHEWADGVYYADFVRTVTKVGKGKVEKYKAVDGRGERILRCKPHAARDGKDRCGMPATLPLDYSAFAKAYYAAQPAPDSTAVDEDPEPIEEATPSTDTTKTEN